MEVNIHSAKTNLSQLILKAESGEEVIIARAGKPVVRLVPVEPQEQTKKHKSGTLKDTLKTSPGFFDPSLSEEIAKWFNESPLLRTDGAARHEKADKKSHKRKKHKG